MGNSMKKFFFHKKSTVSDHLDSSLSEFEDLFEEKENNARMLPKSLSADNSTDAVLQNQLCHNLNSGILPENVINLDDVKTISRELDNNELISLLFILKDESLLLNQEKLNDSLYTWANKQNTVNKNWPRELVEALTIIKNFEVLKKYGFKKDDLINDYFPLLEFSSRYVNVFRKCLYCIFETFSLQMEQDFLSQVQDDFKKKKLVFKKFSQLELYSLYWLQIEYITEKDLSNVKQIFKFMEMDIPSEKLRALSESFNKKMEVEKVTNTEEYNLSNFSNLSSSQSMDDNCPIDNVFLERVLSNSSSNQSFSQQDNVEKKRERLLSSCPQEFVEPGESIYDMSGKKILLIINQKNFYTEIDPDYQHLLPKNTIEKLQERIGSEKDEENLEDCFKRLNFNIKIKTDLTHSEMEQCINETVYELDSSYSCLFICILSHGNKGVVYGVNSCEVKVEQIRDIMCNNKALKSKPKVLILQSCQGPDCQSNFLPVIDDNLTTDSPSFCKTPLYDADFLTCWATVPGYSAIRNKRNGSWFIQTLCEKINRLSDSLHFEDIITKVISQVSEKKWKKDRFTECFMVPLKESNFTKSLFLKPKPL